MAKSLLESMYVCSNCSVKSHKWVGQCASCGSWNSLDRTSSTAIGSSRGGQRDNPGPRVLSEIEAADDKRYQTGLTELDRVLGGGIVPGSVVLLGGEPGIGKSTLALQALAMLSAVHPVLYVSAEESLEQLAMRYQRLSLDVQGLQALAEGQVEHILE